MREVQDKGTRESARVLAWWIAILGGAAAIMPFALLEWAPLAWTGAIAGLVVALAAGLHATRGPVTAARMRATSLLALAAAAWILVHPYLFDARVGYRYGTTVVGGMLLVLAAMDLYASRRERPRGRAVHR